MRKEKPKEKRKFTYGLCNSCYTCRRFQIEDYDNIKCILGNNIYRTVCKDYKKADKQNELLVGKKQCASCHKFLPYSEFYKEVRYHCGLMTYCKGCTLYFNALRANKREELQHIAEIKEKIRMSYKRKK